jgi:hypothetical protein
VSIFLVEKKGWGPGGKKSPQNWIKRKKIKNQLKLKLDHDLQNLTHTGT